MRAYLDYASTTPLDERVLEAMLPWLREEFANPTGIYSLCQSAKRAVEEARESVAKLIGASSSEIVFTSSGTEACNLAVKGYALANRRRGRHIVVSAVEHMAVLEACRAMESQGFSVSVVGVDEHGCVTPEALEQAMSKDTLLVAVQLANNEIGTVQEVAKLAELAHEHGAAFFCDACIANGSIPIDVEELDVELLAMSAHKMYGPKGAGALYLAEGTRIEPLLHGGGQERGYRSGTENVPAIVGFGRACEIAGEVMQEEAERLRRLRDEMVRRVMSEIEDVRLNGHPERRLPGNANFAFAYIEGESLVLELDFAGVSVSTGSACTSPTLEPSHVLTAIGLSKAQAHGSLRVTLGRFTRKEEVEHFLSVLPGVVERLRKISPFKRGGEGYV
ncbi:MAG: cysteine desulfurase [Euryarchaeota archaeon]|nr:cysteine desulfurase [Euryarchaeota archaeon]